MKNQLDRRDNEKVWNVLQEIKGVFLDSKKSMELPLLGGWVLNAHKERVGSQALKTMIAKRIWAFEYICHKGVIKIKKLPRKNNLNGEFVFTLDKQKFERYYKSCQRSYKGKAAAYQQEVKEEGGLVPKTDPKLSGEYKDKNSIGYLILGKKEVQIGKTDSRRAQLVKYLWHPDRFGRDLSVPTAFESIRINNDSKNTRLRSEATRLNEEIKLLKSGIKEVNRILKRNKINSFKLSLRNRLLKAELKFSSGTF